MDDVAVFLYSCLNFHFFDQYATGHRCTCKTFPGLVCTRVVSKTRGVQMENSFMLVSSLLLLSRFDLIDGMLLLDSTWYGRDRTESFVLKFVLIGLDLIPG